MMTYSNEEPLEPMEVSEIDLNQVAMQIILHSGSAKTLADEAFQLAKEKKFKEAYAKMEQAETEGILKAHQAQTLVIQEEARGLAHAPSLLFTHCPGSFDDDDERGQPDQAADRTVRTDR